MKSQVLQQNSGTGGSVAGSFIKISYAAASNEDESGI